ncbi:MAG: hypothetical protein PHC81_06005, partial [Clostridia bacterium]|nr:hypothetical protein [Clostridia bacterium]
MKRTVLIVIISLIVCLVFSGCGLLNKVRQDFDKSERTAKDNILDDPVVLIETPGDMATVADETKLITLYFADPLENKLVAEER